MKIAGDRRRLRVLIGAAVALVALVAVVAVASLRGHGTEDESGDAPAGGIETIEAPSSPSPPSGSAGTPSGGPTWPGPTPPPSDPALRLGKESAPVTIVEFGDFRCPNCGEFARTIKPALVAKYVDTGVVRIYWRDFPVFGKESERDAVAARAASRQGRFWQFHDALYAGPRRVSGDRSADARLRDIARRVGLDLRRYDADVRDPKVAAAVADDFRFGQLLGVPGTPAFLINGEPFFGAQPVAAFERAIEKARAGKSIGS